MVAPIRIVALGYGSALARRIERACQAEEDLQFLGAAQDPQELLTHASSPEAILIHGQVSDEEGLWLIQEVITSLPRAAVVVLVEKDQMDFVQRALLAGARGFLLQPFTDTELRESIRRIHRLETDRMSRLVQDSPEENLPRGKILSVFSPKGGVGRTTIASNLAIALRQEGGSVALLDGSFQFGDVPVVLNIHSRADITSLVRHAEDLEPELLMETLVSHSSGISVLSAPSQLEEAGVIDPQAMTAILRALQRQFEYVVIDAWPFLDENTLAMLEMSDRILLVVTPEMPALRETRLFLEVTDALDYPPSKLLLVLNRAMSAFGIGAADIEENIRYKIAVNIPSDGRLVTRSLNRGVPLIVSDPQSQVARAIVRLASLLIDGTRETVPQRATQTQRKRPSGLSHRLRPLLASQ